MNHEQLTFQWLTPIMMGLIAFLVGIIGIMIKGYLATLADSMDKMGNNVEGLSSEMRKYFDNNEKRHHENELKIVRIQEHLKAS